MARRKRKQRQDSIPRKTSQSNVREPEHAALAGGAASPTAAPQQPGPRTGISPATCIAGMFLTLVLGIYLGTLLPGVLKDMQTQTPPAAPAPAPASPEAPGLDPELAQTVSELEKKAAANPDSAPDWINLGNIYFDALQPNKAIPAYEHALLLAPGNADVLTDLGIMYRETGQFEKALDCFRKAIAINPRHENAMYNEGVVLSVDLHRNDDAIAAWQRLLNLNPQAHAPNGKPLSEMIRNLQ